MQHEMNDLFRLDCCFEICKNLQCESVEIRRRRGLGDCGHVVHYRLYCLSLFRRCPEHWHVDSHLLRGWWFAADWNGYWIAQGLRHEHPESQLSKVRKIRARSCWDIAQIPKLVSSAYRRTPIDTLDKRQPE